MSGVTMQSADDSVKKTVPQRKTRRLPKRSASLPIGNRQTMEASRKISSTQPSSLAEAP